MPNDTLYSRIGGEPGVRRVIDGLYLRVMGDIELEPFFRYAPMQQVRSRQVELLSMVLDGPAPYLGRPIDYVHEGRGITYPHLRRFLDHLLEAIQEVHPDEADAREIVNRMRTYRPAIVGIPGEM